MNFFTLLQAALTLCCIYGLLSMSHALSYHLCGLFQYAHGDLLMLGGYAGLLILQAGGSLFLALTGSALLCGFASLAAGAWVYEPLKKRPAMASFLAGIGLSFLLQACMLIGFGAAPTAYPGSVTGGQVFFARQTVPTARIITLSVFSAVFLSLLLAYRKSPRFLVLRAAASDVVGAASCGISRSASARTVYFLGGALAGLSGVLYGLSFPLSPSAGTVLGLRAFCAAVLGGDGAPFSAVCGGLILGLAECLLAGLFPSPFLDAALFFLLFLLLFTRRKKLLLR